MRLLPPLVWVGPELIGAIRTEGFSSSEMLYKQSFYAVLVEVLRRLRNAIHYSFTVAKVSVALEKFIAHKIMVAPQYDQT